MRTVTITTGSRLHFGLLRPTGQGDRMFGGAGMMVDAPRIVVRAECESDSRNVHAVMSPEIIQRIQVIEERWYAHALVGRQLVERDHPRPHLSVLENPTLHSGLGTGTQLGLAVTAALGAYWNVSLPSHASAVEIAQRGKRSAIGTHGFFHGGLLIDGGHAEKKGLGNLIERVGIPETWRIALLTPRHRPNAVTGTEEEQRFAACGVPDEILIQRLESLLAEELVEGARREDFPRFASAVTRYNHDAGILLADSQGGAYHGPAITELIEHIQSIGPYGVGQSSWGPTVFAICQDETAADHLIAAVAGMTQSCQLVAPLNRGARMECQTS